MFFNADKTIKSLLKEGPKSVPFQWNQTKNVLLFYDIEDSIEIKNVIQHLHSEGKSVTAFTIGSKSIDETESILGTIIPIHTNRRNGFVLKKQFNICTQLLGESKWDLLIDLSSKEGVLFPLMAAYVHPKLRCGKNSSLRYYYNLLIDTNDASIKVSEIYTQLITMVEKTERS